ncbi:hypothetical protein LTR10_023570 [Elasticomyces elasticus]|uniref:Uncharacterized protein n=1 Tax=Exophiala sideris TaxID=1016849 RepID=A0ABR0J632_9EURO|nr:hypothetical protein LTR10_023570 [Elasticomyces elasticus]KAK5028760.1 hypothetical protein LTS07_006139 [Exophiala sideris]KAK5035629.1 hypothetical protein LTR13_005758 [Exophiala sideris]KAK5057264.1 hypothetical protein LTR69_007303 [Exophiala sideris]KAK5181763.1 hypothetical protein LTR44_005963 [Eurotiomycetes sp. CCFEE 6388]
MTAIMDSPGPLPGSYFSNETFRCAHFISSLFVPPAHDGTPSPILPSRTLSRKRPRLDRHHRTNDTQTPFCEALSPPPFVNTNYRIAGGLDTPTALNFQNEEDAQQYEFEVDCRPNRYATKTTDSYFPHTPSDECTTSTRNASRSPREGGWGKTVWALTGGVAGKVFNFCWNTTFKGFYAGGGNGYDVAGTPNLTASSDFWVGNEKEDVFHDEYQHSGHGRRRHQRDHTPIPGGFPDEAEGRRPATIRTTSDWVIVDEHPDRDRESDASPVRKRSKATTASLHTSRSSTTLGTAMRLRLTPRSASGRSSASFASPRSSSAAVPVVAPAPVSKVDSVKQHRRAVSSFQHQQPESRPGSRASLASPRRQSSVPASPEVRKFEQKLRRKEAKQDQTMNRFAAQLQAMIREGQEALGARIEVVDGDGADTEVDEGYGEGFIAEKEYPYSG